MINKLVFALTVTTICNPIDPAFALSRTNLLEKEQTRSIVIKRRIERRDAITERLIERRKARTARKSLREIRRQSRIEQLVQRHQMRRSAKLARLQRKLDLRGGSARRARVSKLRAMLLVKDKVKAFIKPVGARSRYPVILPPHIENLQSNVRSNVNPLVSLNLEELNLYEHIASAASQTPRIVEETPQQTYGMTPIIETVGAAIQYVQNIFTPTPTPTPMDEETPFAGEGSMPLAQGLTPLETETPFIEDETEPLIPITVSKLENPDDFASFDDAENPERKLEAKVAQLVFGSSSPQNDVLFAGQRIRSGSSSSEDVERKPKVSPLSFDSPNAVRVEGRLIGSGSSSPDEASSPSSSRRFQTKKIPRQLSLESLTEEPENELTLSTLQPKLQALVRFGKTLTLPTQETCRKNAADSCSKLRASIEGTQKTAVPGELREELQLLQGSITQYLSKEEPDQAPSPRSAFLENVNVRYVDNWLNELFRLNGLTSDK